MKQVNSSTTLTVGESMLQTGHVVKDKWQVMSKIGQGAFGEVYKCKDFTSNRQVALKLVSKERVQSASHLLKLEVTVLKELQGKHFFPKFVGFGKTERFDYLVMELLGPSLSELKKHQPDRKFSLSTTLRLGSMMLKCIHSIHKAGYLHRDIKPSNFTIGIGEDNRRKVYLLDFGLARQYVLDTGDVRPPRYKVSFHGTPRYASLRVLQGKEAGRQDDLMSLFYTLSEFSFRDLPWKNIRDYREMAQAKEAFDHQVLVKEFPDEFQDFYDHISALTFFDQPDYDLLYSVFDRCIKRRGVKDTDPFDFEESKQTHLRVDNNSTVPTKSLSDVLIIDCASYEESDNLKAKNEIKRSKSTSNHLHRLVPASGLDEIRKDQLLRSRSSNNMMNKKNISNFCNNSKDTGYSVSPFSTNSHCHPSISISMEPDYPVTKPNLTPTKLKSQSSVESNKCFTESLFMDSLSRDNFSFETHTSKVLNKLLKKEPSLNRSPCIDTLSTLRCFKDKGKKQKTRHSVRRSVSHPASVPSHLFIKSIFHDSRRAQGQQGLPRCWSCPTISLFIRSDLKPPLKQQASFDENVYEVDVMRNVAAKQPADEQVHVDCRRNSLPFLQTISDQGSKQLVPNISDSGIASLSETRRGDVVVPTASVTKEFEKTNATQDVSSKVQKSLSDSNVYQRSFNNNVRVRRDARVGKTVIDITQKENGIKSVKMDSFAKIHHSNAVKNMANLSVELISLSHSKSESNAYNLSDTRNGLSSKYLTAERNNRIIKQEPAVVEKVYNAADLEVERNTSGIMNQKSLINNTKDHMKHGKAVNDSKSTHEKDVTVQKNMGTFDSLNITNIQIVENVNKTNVSDESAKGILAKLSENQEIKVNVPSVYVTENDNNMDHLMDTKSNIISKTVISDETEEKTFAKLSESHETKVNVPSVYVTEDDNNTSQSLEIHTKSNLISKTDTSNKREKETSSKLMESHENQAKVSSVYATENDNNTAELLEINTRRNVIFQSDTSDKIEKEIPAILNESHDNKANVPSVFMTENDNTPQLLEIDTRSNLISENEISNKLVPYKNQIKDMPHKVSDIYLLNQASRRHRTNSDNKYVKDESELKLQFTRRRQRPVSVVGSSEFSDEYESHELPLARSSSGMFRHEVELMQSSIEPPAGDPPSDYCLPSRRRRYRRTATSLSTLS